ncbi:MAG: hypothetical protein MZW92_64365 [Comamonadaceae bacterium]|nr:hypothetical protein [Comamonadaceae bacterium]
MRKALQFVVLFFCLRGRHRASPPTRVKVVYHFSEGLEQASQRPAQHQESPRRRAGRQDRRRRRNVQGIDFLLEGAEDKNKNPYNVDVEELAAKGVEFQRLQQYPDRDYKIDKSIASCRRRTIVPARRGGNHQAAKPKEGYAYPKP